MRQPSTNARSAVTATGRRRRNEIGGAVSLLVMLMVPVCVFAAIAAVALPKRLAAGSAADAAAADLATLAVAWRDAQGRDHDVIGWFFDDCAPLRDPTTGTPPHTGDNSLRHVCETLTASLLAGLSARGFDYGTVTGTYSSAYTTAGAGDDVHAVSLPCHAGGRTVAADAVYLALTAEWATGDWAAAQVWPDGITISTEAVGRITRSGDATDGVEGCGDLFDVVPLEARLRLDDRARAVALSLPTHTAFGSR